MINLKKWTPVATNGFIGDVFLYEDATIFFIGFIKFLKIIKLELKNGHIWVLVSLYNHKHIYMHILGTHWMYTVECSDHTTQVAESLETPV